MKIILFVLLFISAQIEVYAQQKQSKKSWAIRETPVEVIEAKKTKLYSLVPSYGRIISLEPYSIISKINEELAIINNKLKRFLKLKENKVISNDVFDDLRIKKINLNKKVSKIEFDLKNYLIYFYLVKMIWITQ